MSGVDVSELATKENDKQYLTRINKCSGWIGIQKDIKFKIHKNSYWSVPGNQDFGVKGLIKNC